MSRGKKHTNKINKTKKKTYKNHIIKKIISKKDSVGKITLYRSTAPEEAGEQNFLYLIFPIYCL